MLMHILEKEPAKDSFIYMWVPRCDVTKWQRTTIVVFYISIYIYLGPEIEPPLASYLFFPSPTRYQSSLLFLL
jgi:hypothetical protein